MRVTEGIALEGRNHAMQQWEDRYIYLSRDTIEDGLNRFGAQGWEVIASTRSQGDNGAYFTLKRPKA